jgi:hypothetical protein
MNCPVDWSREFPDDEAWRYSFPYLDWYYCLSLYAVDGDDLPYYPHDFDDFSDPPEELQRMIMNLDDRRPSAVELYMTRAGRLKGLQFMRPADHGKHYIGDIDSAEMKRRTKHGPSLFHTNYSSDRLEQTFWYWFQMYFGMPQYDLDVAPPYRYNGLMQDGSAQYATPEARLWRKFLNAPQLRIVVGTLESVGASRGEMTTLICYDLHLDSKIVHCYPVSDVDVRTVMEDGDVLVDDSFHYMQT